MTKTILIVEDDKELLDLYVEILQVNRYNVQTAIDGEEAVSKYRQIHLDLVVMDMPKLDGYEAFSQIIKIDKNAKVVTVIGYSEFEQKNKSSRARIGFCYFKTNWRDILLGLAKKYLN